MITPRNQALPKGERGSALLVALVFASVLAIAAASYQTLAYYSLKNASNSGKNSRAMQMAEAGMEEALYSLNNSDWTGWTLSGGNATKTLSNFSLGNGTSGGSVTGTASITITNYLGTSGKPTLTVNGTVTDSDGTARTRTYTASTGVSGASTTGRTTLFNNAVAAVGIGYSGYGDVTFTYNGITVDSFDASAGTGYSTGGYSAVIAAIASGTDSSVNGSTSNTMGYVGLGTATVKGYLATSPLSTGGAAYTSSTGAKVTGSASGSGIDSSRLTTAPYQVNQTISAPSGATTNISAPTGTMHIGTSGATTPALYYGVSDTSGNFDIENSGDLEIDGPVYLIVPGNFYIGAYAGGGSIKINAGGSLQVFVAGYSYISGNGINNTTLLPKNMAIFSTSTVSGYYTLFYTNQAFYGVVYAPNTDVYLYSRATSSAFMGSFVGRNAYIYNFVASMGVHYDTSLRDASFAAITNTPYAISSVTEQ